MDKYELVVIVDAALSQEEKDGVIKDVCQAIEKYDGKVLNSEIWLERQRMSFLMKKRPEGTYYFVHFEGGSGSIPELRTALKLNDKVLRSLVIKETK